MSTTTVTCPGCGGFVPLGDRFCGSCGTPISGSALMSGESSRFDPWEELLQKLRQATIGEYEIKGELGRGGMAAVLLAHDLQLNRKVAIKVMLPGLVYGASMWERFLSEARTAAKLDHPNIIYIHSVKERDRFLYFVMKYIDGRSLDDILTEKAPLPVKVAQTILVEVARGLDYAHSEGVVHRDIKPANIMIDQKGTAIVMDFGIARATDEKRFTQTGATIGTPAYMSPEQCRGNETTAASDQYSLGVLAYEMLTGAPPFVGTPIELQISHMQDAPRALRDSRPELPLELSGAIMRMLAKEPGDRWPSLQQLVPIFGRGLDADDSVPRDQLVQLVRAGAARRTSFPATPVSPTPAHSATISPSGARSAAALPSSPTTAVSASELAEHAQRMSMEASALVSGPQPSSSLPARTEAARPASPTPPSVPAAESPPQSSAANDFISTPQVDSPLTPDAEDASPSRARPRWLAPALGGAVVVTVGLWAIFVRDRGTTPAAGTKPGSAASVTASDSAGAAAGTPTPANAASAVESALGDSVVVGHGADATATVNGKAPRTVTPDAVSLTLLSLPKPRVRLGDTVRVKLELQDDSGLPVTTHQVVWTTSNPRVLRFLAPGQMIAVAEGRVSVSVSVGSAKGTQVVNVEPRATPAPAKKAPARKKTP